MKTLLALRRWGGVVGLAGALQAVPSAEGELGFLGPRGTFSEEAAETYRRATPDVGVSVPFETMTHVIEALREARVSRAILPVASTVAGFPAESSELFIASGEPGFRVVSEIVLPIELHLLAKPGTLRDGIGRILSHPNALGESGAYLDEHFSGIAREETASTAAAAERVSRGDGTHAAVASVAAARLYGLEILAEDIHEDPDNATSFWVLARPGEVTVPENVTRFVALLDAPAGSRALSETIASLHEVGFNVVFSNSRPLPGELYGFRYLLSFAAREPVETKRIRATLASMADLGDARLLPLGWFS